MFWKPWHNLIKFQKAFSACYVEHEPLGIPNGREAHSMATRDGRGPTHCLSSCQRLDTSATCRLDSGVSGLC